MMRTEDPVSRAYAIKARIIQQANMLARSSDVGIDLGGMSEAERMNLQAVRKAMKWLNDCDDADWWLNNAAHYDVNEYGRKCNIRARHGSEVLVRRARELTGGN